MSNTANTFNPIQRVKDYKANNNSNETVYGFSTQNNDITMDFSDITRIKNNRGDLKTHSVEDRFEAMNPLDNYVVDSSEIATFTTIDGEAGYRRKVEYTEEDIEVMARIVQREADIDSGLSGAVAVAEEIRNRVVSDISYYPDTLHGVLFQGVDGEGKYMGYIPKDHNSPLDNTEPAREDVKEICRKVLDGEMYVFGQDNILGHASHDGTDIYDHMGDYEEIKSYGAFYYDNVNRTQTFYTNGEAHEVSVINQPLMSNKL